MIAVAVCQQVGKRGHVPDSVNMPSLPLSPSSCGRVEVLGWVRVIYVNTKLPPRSTKRPSTFGKHKATVAGRLRYNERGQSSQVRRLANRAAVNCGLSSTSSVADSLSAEHFCHENTRPDCTKLGWMLWE
ncbi:hypothetical protein J6590_012425 [Homalodisca vitripennis]|nr:hypothetical protein J6590_012425 [Homalodisca vitripennis]